MLSDNNPVHVFLEIDMETCQKSYNFRVGNLQKKNPQKHPHILATVDLAGEEHENTAYHIGSKSHVLL